MITLLFRWQYTVGADPAWRVGPKTVNAEKVNDDDAPGQNAGARRILYALASYETPDVLPSIKRARISFPENVNTRLWIWRRGL
jgi:hypothetical protein